MPLPYVIARFNKRVSNRFIEPIARRSDGFAVVHHMGRFSGTPYSTPVNLFELHGDAIVSLTYGPGADWVQNVLDSGGTVEDRSGLRHIESAEVVDRTIAWPALPRVVRAALRLARVDQFMRLSFA
ncbi:MAG: nitroreductase family deazaflavin-dependent oxidoreductase [Acidimicrobiales bacterium]